MASPSEGAWRVVERPVPMFPYPGFARLYAPLGIPDDHRVGASA